ncbi:hypothetical protein [Limimaricola litoreus]|uniref:hypothetical protein n=1 Tax=Limimaricola litoreus TaxID=2955316 RepID=UPI0020A000D3|nr:hypothetical protein [Limimaricola litoreus]
MAVQPLHKAAMAVPGSPEAGRKIFRHAASALSGSMFQVAAYLESSINSET